MGLDDNDDSKPDLKLNPRQFAIIDTLINQPILITT